MIKNIHGSSDTMFLNKGNEKTSKQRADKKKMKKNQRREHENTNKKELTKRR